jgi:hypothetical protein
LFGLSQRQLFEYISQVGIGFQTVGFGGLDKSKKGGTGLGTIRTAGEQPVLSFMWNSA